MMRLHHNNDNRQLVKPMGRRATTMAEVLVSIMILSIGIISLATLFPISILRSLQATQLTNATILRFNAESMIDVTPGMIYDPDENNSNNNYSNYIVDPLGYVRMGTGSIGSLQRFPGGSDFNPAVNPLTAETDALTAVTLPDSWVDVAEGTFDPVVVNPTNQITLPADIDLSNLPYNPAGDTQNLISRIVLMDGGLRRSHTREITNITGQTVEWGNAGRLTNNGSIPTGFNAGAFRIQTREIRYTWLLTVRNSSSASVDVVVFFRRSFSPVDEIVYTATFVDGRREVGINTAGGEPAIKKGGFVLDVQNAQWYRVQDIRPVTGNPSYDLFLDIERPADGGAGEDRNLNGILDTADPTEDLNENGTLDFGGAVFMQGVVEVYHLGTK